MSDWLMRVACFFVGHEWRPRLTWLGARDRHAKRRVCEDCGKVMWLQ